MRRKLMQMSQLGGNMGRRLSEEEKDRICALRDQGKTNKEIIDELSKEFYIWPDRSTIQRVLARRPRGQAVRDLCVRGAHLWVKETLSSRTSFKAKDSKRQPAGYFVHLGKMKTCRYCGKTESSTMVKVKTKGTQTIPTDFGTRESPPTLQPVAEG
jgi:hypothetical protein